MCLLSDVSSGSSYSILDEMRSVLHVSNSLSLTGHDNVPFNYKNVFFMATLGSAKDKVRVLYIRNDNYRVKYVFFYNNMYYNFQFN